MKIRKPTDKKVNDFIIRWCDDVRKVAQRDWLLTFELLVNGMITHHARPGEEVSPRVVDDAHHTIA